MPNLTGLTLAQLRAMTAREIQTARKNRIDTMSKRELIELEMDATEFADNAPPQATYWPDSQRKSYLVVVRNALGAKVRSTLTEWTYYPPEDGWTQGPVDTITVSERDASDAVVGQRRIKHFTDGWQPETDES